MRWCSGAAPDAASSGAVAEDERGVDPPEPKRIAQQKLRFPVYARAPHVVQLAGRIGILEVDARRQPLPPAGQRADRGLDRAARTERVTIVALGSADRHPLGM